MTMTITITARATIRNLAESIAYFHTADPLVGRTVAAEDADNFEFLKLGRALQEWGFASSEKDVEALREELRAALGREAAAFADEDQDDDASDATEAVKAAIETSQNENRVIEIADSEAVRSALSLECDDNCDGDNGNYWGENEHGSWCVCVGIEVTT